MSRFIVRLSYLFLFYFLTISASLGASYSLEFSGPSTINAGANFSIEVYLKETLDTGEATKLGDATNGGLSTGNFQVKITGDSHLTSVTGNTDFDNSSTDSPWIVYQSDISGPAPTGTESIAGSGIYRLRLGTIQGTGASTAGTFTISIVDWDTNPSSADMVLLDLANPDPSSLGFLVLDSELFPSSSFDVTVSGAPPIPEPSMCLMFGSAVLLPCARALWGRRKSA
ncbi:MAG: hypothetical protein ACK553_07485 [Planctomycetota bacterium]|jgi:hypothetical protein